MRGFQHDLARGRLLRCENHYADLDIVAVTCPGSATLAVPFECQVTVANHGPHGAHYALGRTPPPPCNSGSCSIFTDGFWTFHTVDHPDAGAPLAAGDEGTGTTAVTITAWPAEDHNQPAVRIRVRTIDLADAIDRAPANDDASTPIERAQVAVRARDRQGRR